jgi:hypothetical protein
LLADESGGGSSITLTLWGDLAKNFAAHNRVIAIKGATVWNLLPFYYAFSLQVFLPWQEKRVCYVLLEVFFFLYEPTVLWCLLYFT